MLYPRLELPLALELVNTQFASDGQPRDAIQTVAGLDAWLRLNGLESGRTSRQDLERFRQLRAALRRLFAAAADGTIPSHADVQALNQVSAQAPHFEQLEWDTDGPRLKIMESAQPKHQSVAAVARSAIEVLTAGAAVHQCQAPGCVLFFIRDARRRQWCSATCGNRARVARHYVRHRRAE